MKHYIPGLNGIRAIAVFFVIISHRFPIDSITRLFPLGGIGVDVFFSLSGFLISRILIQGIDKVRRGESDNYTLIKNFILRRALRIFPLYYSVLFFLYYTKGLFGNNIKENFYWYFFYAANFLVYKENRWFNGLAHLWSLSVEEQFYLVWPFILVILFKNRILLLIVLVIIIGTIYPFFFKGFTAILTLSCINAFGVGTLLAYVELKKKRIKNSIYENLKDFIYFSFCFILLLSFSCKHTLFPRTISNFNNDYSSHSNLSLETRKFYSR